MANLQPGTKVEWRRTFSEAEVRQFAEFSGDKGRHHLEPDDKGRLMVHGLLTASLPTKIGGDFNFIARSMHFEFLRPAYTGEELLCSGRIESVEPQPKRWLAVFSFVVSNPKGKVLLKGSCDGVIYRLAGE